MITPEMTPRISRIRDSMNASLSLKKVKTTSSRMYGAQSAAANGHPRMPPMANQKIPCEVLSPPRQFMNAAAPSMHMYMAKLDGKKAALAWKLPGLVTVAMRKKMAILPLRVRLMTLNRTVWHSAQTKARPYRTK